MPELLQHEGQKFPGISMILNHKDPQWLRGRRCGFTGAGSHFKEGQVKPLDQWQLDRERGSLSTPATFRLDGATMCLDCCLGDSKSET